MKSEWCLWSIRSSSVLVLLSNWVSKASALMVCTSGRQ